MYVLALIKLPWFFEFFRFYFEFEQNTIWPWQLRGESHVWILYQPLKIVVDELQKELTENETHSQKMSVYSQHNQHVKSI
jgi:hypothetical protein